MVASVKKEGRRDSVIIEALVAPGNSGGPVFLERNNRLYFLGLISSEVAHITEITMGWTC